MTDSAPSDADGPTRIDASSLPEEVRLLWETMLRLNPTWDLGEWLAARAGEELRLVEANLGRERMRLEQRLHRVNTLAERLKRMGISVDEVRWNDPHQRNLFDIFPSREVEMDAQTDPIESAQEMDEVEQHPAGALLDYLPGEPGDDPLLAIVAQLVLVEMEQADAAGLLPLSLEDMGNTFDKRGISPDELVEAIEWLLERDELVEMAEDMFGLGTG